MPCGCSRLWPFRFAATSVSGRFGLWQFRYVAVSVCGHFGLWPFRFVAASVCGLFGVWPFRFVAASVVAFRFVADMTCYPLVISLTAHSLPQASFCMKFRICILCGDDFGTNCLICLRNSSCSPLFSFPWELAVSYDMIDDMTYNWVR